jgi:hypothetical protein
VGIVGWIQFLHPSDGVTLTAHHIEKRIITNTWDYYKYVGLLQIRGIITNTWDYYKYVYSIKAYLFIQRIQTKTITPQIIMSITRDLLSILVCLRLY